MTILSLRHLFLSAVTPPHRAEVWRGIGPPLHVGPTLAPVAGFNAPVDLIPELLIRRDMGQCGPIEKLFPSQRAWNTYKLIWAELWHGKKAGIATSHGDRKRRTRNDKWGQIGIWSRSRCSAQFRGYNHIWIMERFLIHFPVLFVEWNTIFEGHDRWLSIIRESTIVVNKTCPGTCGRLLYYNGRPLLSGIVALNLMKLL